MTHTLAKKLTNFWPWKERFSWAIFSTKLWHSFDSSFNFLLLAPRSKEATGEFVCDLLVPGSRIPVGDVSRFSASLGSGTVEQLGSWFFGTRFADTGEWRRFSLLLSPRRMHQQATWFAVPKKRKQTANKLAVRSMWPRSKKNRSKVLSKERQMPVKKVSPGNHFFYGQKSVFSKVPFFATDSQVN